MTLRILLFAGLCAAAAAASPIRVALWIGKGSDWPRFSSRASLSMLRNATAAGWIDAAVTTVSSHADLEANLTNTNYDVVFFPGGSGSGEDHGITPQGKTVVRDFVKGGGGYLGICGGAYLGLDHSTGLRLVAAGAKQPWDRGGGTVKISFTDAGRSTLGLADNATDSGGAAAVGYGSGEELVIHYGQGPIFTRVESTHLPPFDQLATYRTEIHSKHTKETKGQMTGAPAIISGPYGDGRVLLSSPHPELTGPKNYYLFLHYINYVAGRL